MAAFNDAQALGGTECKQRVLGSPQEEPCCRAWQPCPVLRLPCRLPPASSPKCSQVVHRLASPHDWPCSVKRAHHGSLLVGFGHSLPCCSCAGLASLHDTQERLAHGLLSMQSAGGKTGVLTASCCLWHPERQPCLILGALWRVDVHIQKPVGVLSWSLVQHQDVICIPVAVIKARS